MELGYYFYEKVYTKQEEREIEQRRVKRKPTKIKPTKQTQIPALVQTKSRTPAPVIQQKSSNKRLDKWVTRFDKNDEA